MSQTEKILNKKLNDLNSIYLIYSNEKYLLEEFRKKFENKFVANNIRDFNLNYIDDDNPDFIQSLKSKTKTLPTFAEKRFIIANCKNYFLQKNSGDSQLIKLFNDFSETTILLLLVKGKIDKRLKVNKSVKNNGVILELQPPKYKNLDNWIRKKFKEKGKTIDKRSINLLEEMFSNNLQLLEKEIEKIDSCFFDKKSVNKNDIRKIISRDKTMKEDVIFSLTDALSERNKEKAITLFNEMINNGENPLMILTMIKRQIRLLIQVKELKAKGYKYKKIANILKEHPYPIKKCFYQVDNFKSEELDILLERFLEANIDILTGKYKEKKVAVEMAMLNI
ncbi:MAG: DNA polymerase III subunit delta [Bacillota bacterium]